MIGRDPRMIDVLGVLMGIDMQGFGRPEGSDELPPGFEKATPPPSFSNSPPPAPKPSTSSAPPPSSSKPKVEEVVEEDVEMEDEDDEDKKAQKEADAEKKLGSEAYKKRDFATAAKHFEKAWDLWPKDITFLSNLGGERDSCGIYAPAESSRIA
jgi:hypothetical protein